MSKYLCIMSLFLGSLLYGQSPQIAYYNFTKADGLSDVTILDFAQDENGFIWAATATGLYMHDGHKFVLLRSPLDNSEHKISVNLTKLYYDTVHHFLWLYSTSDLQYFDIKDRTFHRALPSVEINTCISGDGVELTLWDEQQLLLCTENGDFLIEVSTGKKKVIDLGRQAFQTIRVFAEKAKKKWVVCSGGIVPYTLPTQVGRMHQLPFQGNITEAVYDAAHASIWLIVDEKVLAKYHIPTASFEHIKVLGARVQDVVLRKDELWFGSGHFYSIETKKEQFIPYQDGLYSNAVQYWPSGFVDKQLNYWCGSGGFGANVQMEPNRYVRGCRLKSKADIGIEPYDAVMWGKDSLLAVGNGLSGIQCINLISGAQYYWPAVEAHGISNRIVKTPTGEVLTSIGNRIFARNPRKAQLKQWLEIPNGEGVRQMAIVQHQLMVVTDSKIIAIDPVQKSILFSIPLQNNLPNGTHLFSVSKDGETAYFNQGNQLCAIQPLTAKIEPIHLLHKGNEIHISEMTDVELLGKTLWISTLSNGLFSYDVTKKSLEHYSRKNSALGTDHILKIVHVHAYLYLSTSLGIYVFDPVQGRIIDNYDRQTGFSRDDSGYNLLPMGAHEFAKLSYNQIDLLDVKEITKSAFPPQTYITYVDVQSVRKIGIPYTGDTSLYLGYTENSIEVTFTNTSYANFNKNKFCYRLLGLDTAWKTTSDHFLKYARLNPGRYTLQIKSSTFDGVWDETPVVLHFRIKPPFWKTWWFILGLFGTLGLLVLSIYRLKIEQFKSEAALEQRFQKLLAETEMKALRAQMNPHFIFNALNSIQKFIFEKNEYAASQYLTKFARLIRLILDLSNQDFVSLESELELLQLYVEMEQLRFGDKFTYQVHLSPNINTLQSIPSMLIQPHIENAIWHGLMHRNSPGRLDVYIQSGHSGKITITIEDNGVGRMAAKRLMSKQILKKKSYGSKLTEERIRQLNLLHKIESTYTVEDKLDAEGNALGTKVIITIATKLQNYD